MLARGRQVRQSRLLFYAKMAEKALQTYERDGWGEFPTQINLDRREARAPPPCAAGVRAIRACGVVLRVVLWGAAAAYSSNTAALVQAGQARGQGRRLRLARCA